MGNDPTPRDRIRAVLTPRGLLVVAAVVALLALVVVFVGAQSSGAGSVSTVTGAPTEESRPSSESESGSVSPSATTAAVVVHVLGAVAHPGLLTLAAGDRVQAAIDQAGGTTDGADLARVNLARPLVDGEQLYVPTVGEDPPVPLDATTTSGVPGGSAGAGAGGSDVVDLNRADSAALQTLPGIGPALAARIIGWREANGGFGSVDDLRDVSGIGEVRFAELEPLVRV